MTRLLLIASGVALLAGSGIAVAQVPPPAPGGAEMHDGGGPGGNGPRWAMMRHMRPAMGAGFRFRKGDTEIGIRCPASESVQACVTAAGTLIDKIGSMPQPKTP